MRDERDVMIEAQARHISKYREEIAALTKLLSHVERANQAMMHEAGMYLLIQKMLREHPMVREAWDNFLVMLRLNGVDDEYFENAEQVAQQYFQARLKL